jgi:hypothetical protein
MNEFQPLPLELSARICVTLLHSVWQVAVLAALAWLAGRFWCKRSVEWAYTVNVWALMLGLACVPVTYMLSGHPQKSDVAAVTYVQPSAITTREGTAGVLRLTAQITEARDITGGIMTEDHLFESVGFNRGVKYVLSTMSVPAVSEAAVSEATVSEPGGSEPAADGER